MPGRFLSEARCVSKAAWTALGYLGFFLVVPHGVWAYGKGSVEGRILVGNEFEHKASYSENAEKVEVPDISVPIEPS
jgi:hypothetical protein